MLISWPLIFIASKNWEFRNIFFNRSQSKLISINILTGDMSLCWSLFFGKDLTKINFEARNSFYSIA